MNSCAGSLGPVSNLSHVTVYRDVDSGYNAAFPQVAQLSGGRLIVSFRQAPFPPTDGLSTSNVALHNHADIKSRGVIVRSVDSGLSWDLATLRVLAEPAGGIEQVSVSAITGEVLLSPYSERRELHGGHPVKVRRSFDGGVVWDEPVMMHTGPLKGARTHAPMLELPDGTLLSPHCGLMSDRSRVNVHAVTVVRSEDRGCTWGDISVICKDLEAVDSGNSTAFHQASLVLMPGGEIIAAMQSGGKRLEGQVRPMMGFWISRSSDAGYTWSAPERLPIRISGWSR